MNEPNKLQRRDRDGEIFENDLLEEDLPPGGVCDDEDHQLAGDPNVDSQAGDEFMHEHYGKQNKPQP